MAATLNIPIGEGFNMASFGNALFDYFQKQGYVVEISGNQAGFSLRLEKQKKLKWLGLAKAITVDATRVGNSLKIEYTNQEIAGKIIAMVIGMIGPWVAATVLAIVFAPLAPLAPLVFAFFVTGVVGLILQLTLPGNLNEDIKKVNKMLRMGRRPV